MNAETLFDISIEEDNDEKLDESIQLAMDEWVYFFFNEKEGKNTPAGSGNVEQIIFTGKDNPIHIPLIKNEYGVNGVIYFTMEQAKRSVEFDCKIAKMRGHKALTLYYELEPIDAIYLQSSNNYVRIPRAKMKNILSNHKGL